MTAEAPLWHPTVDQIRGSNLARFADLAHAKYGGPALEGAPADNYRRLWSWSTQRPQDFWPAVWEFAGVQGERGSGPALRTGARRQDTDWFSDARLNYAENLLAAPDDAVAIYFSNESGEHGCLSYGELKVRVAGMAAGLAHAGIGVGDVVAGYLPNIPEAVIAMLATASLGAVWTSTSPDFGLEGVLDRFGQTSPKVLFTTDGYGYAGKRHHCLPVVEALVAKVTSIVRTVVIPRLDPAPNLQGLPNAQLLADFEMPATSLQCHRVPFAAPLFVMYSSGTTGRPKCIVHGVGGTLLQHRKEHLLHADLRPADRLFFFTTCGWMMWNWLASALAGGSAIVLFDGSPMHPGPAVLWDLVDAVGITHFGTSPRYLAALEKAGYHPRDHHRLASLRSVLSTGSPLSPAQFDYVYRHIKQDQMLASISGGTDILSCFCLGVPWLPVRRGQIQGPGLGMAVEIWDDPGHRVSGQAGELVCTKPFPSMPVGFWNDVDGAKYHAAYFERFSGVWHHGDRVIETPELGYVFLGRSDAVLNPGGVRIGTAEIYRQLETLDEVLEALAIGQTCTDASGVTDERIVLFLRLREGVPLDEALQAKVRRVIRDNTTPRHVPARIVAVPELPRTRSGKIVELAVKRVVHGLPVDNLDALENPAALDYFRNLPQLQT